MTNVNRTVLFLVVGILTFVCLWFILNPTFKKPQDPMQLATLINNTTPLAPFSLVDTNHQKFTSQNLKGHWNVLFFGYTHCPDICPTTLAILNDTYSKLKDREPPMPTPNAEDLIWVPFIQTVSSPNNAR